MSTDVVLDGKDLIFDGYRFRETKSGLCVPKDLAFNLDHPVLSRVGNVAKNFVAPVLVGAALVLNPFVASAENLSEKSVSSVVQSEIRAPQSSVESPKLGKFIAVRLQDANSSKNFLLRKPSIGGQLIFFHTETEGQDTFSYGLKTPRSAGFSGNAAIVHNSKTLKYNAFLDYIFKERFSLRAGVFGDVDLTPSDSSLLSDPNRLGGLNIYLGGMLNLGKLHINSDLRHGLKGSLEDLALRGIVSFAPGNFYASIGGDSEDKKLTSSVGYLGSNGLMVYHEMVNDFEIGIHKGTVFSGTGSEYNPKKANYRNKVIALLGYYTEEFVSLTGLASFKEDLASSKANSFGFVGDWSYDGKTFSANPRLIYQFGMGFVGLGVPFTYDSSLGEGDAKLGVRLCAKFPGFFDKDGFEVFAFTEGKDFSLGAAYVADL